MFDFIDIDTHVTIGKPKQLQWRESSTWHAEVPDVHEHAFRNQARSPRFSDPTRRAPRGE